MISLTIFAAGALIASLWWCGRMRRAVASWQAYAGELKRQNTDGTRLLKHDAQRIDALVLQIRQLGHEPYALPPANGRKKGVAR